MEFFRPFLDQYSSTSINIHIWPKIGDPALFDYENKNMWLEIFLKASYLINGLGFLVNNSILFSTD